VFREEEQRNIKAAQRKAAAAADEAKPTLGDANEALMALKAKMEADSKKK
jgi:small subunit ribosomal protein S1